LILFRLNIFFYFFLVFWTVFTLIFFRSEFESIWITYCLKFLWLIYIIHILSSQIASCSLQSCFHINILFLIFLFFSFCFRNRFVFVLAHDFWLFFIWRRGLIFLLFYAVFDISFSFNTIIFFFWSLRAVIFLIMLYCILHFNTIHSFLIFFSILFINFDSLLTKWSFTPRIWVFL